MRLLHTADIHIGKTLRGRSRADEHRAVLAHLVEVVKAENIDAVLLAGDNYDGTSPNPESEKILYDSVLSIVEAGTLVIIIAGNHDNPHRWHALKPLMEAHKVFVSAFVAPPDKGGIVDVETPNGRLQVAMVPFLSQRNIVKADDIMSLDRDEHTQSYHDRVATIVKYLTQSMDPSAVRVVMGHLTVAGENGLVLGGGERRAHTVMDYVVTPDAFPATAQYVALGHLHAPQRIPGDTHIRYSGSPMHLDFSDTPDDKKWVIVDIDGPDGHAEVSLVPIKGARKLVTVKGDLETCIAQAAKHPDAYIRVKVVAESRPGLADEVREAIPDAVDVIVLTDDSDDGEASWNPSDGLGDPTELFEEYVSEKGLSEDRAAKVKGLFRELLDEHTTTAA